MIISIASDHAGFKLKSYLKAKLEKMGHSIKDEGCDSQDSCDYPDYARKTCDSIIAQNADFGILICGTGIGMSICANRFSNIRAALCLQEEMSRKAREHNDANILVLGALHVTRRKSLNITKTFMDTNFEGGRHLRRINKIS
ncbi:MAG: ribose 5-phosphate isomerase B [Alphaproteobacteria bacterium]|nr:ribose 5-phosphate isomerase B [Alphaproteobacteria bacterium]